ncbi:hypothetical protein NEDG_01226 [Nematocida displodere]|uniref:Uncharacterized protein n=1 Tax=Nematocida displodere TaxID=1805483 RepID=A0A177EAX0_9MICR|nr:hypothetical protein NEDG_01226 [Nematocida displodere]
MIEDPHDQILEVEKAHTKEQQKEHTAEILSAINTLKHQNDGQAISGLEGLYQKVSELDAAIDKAKKVVQVAPGLIESVKALSENPIVKKLIKKKPPARRDRTLFDFVGEGEDIGEGDEQAADQAKDTDQAKHKDSGEAKDADQAKHKAKDTDQAKDEAKDADQAKHKAKDKDGTSTKDTDQAKEETKDVHSTSTKDTDKAQKQTKDSGETKKQVKNKDKNSDMSKNKP